MDKARHIPRYRKALRKGRLPTILLLVAGAVTLLVSHLEPAAPSVDRRSVLLGEVKRGAMVREVRGAGVLTPEQEIWVTAETNGVVKRILAKPGMELETDTVLLELTNTTMELEILQADWDVRSSELELKSLKTDFEENIQKMRASISGLEDDHKQTELETAGNKEMCEKGYLPAVKMDLTQMQLESISRRIELEKKCLERYEASATDRFAIAEGKIKQVRALRDLKKSRADRLKVRAGVHGVLEQMSEVVGVGKSVGEGTILAKVVDPRNLRAALKVSEMQAREVRIGLPAKVEILSVDVPGRVVRIDPSVVNGSVTVDVELTQNLPQGARPDLSVNGVVEIERLADVVYVERPVYASEENASRVFKVVENGRTALRVPVQFGRSSVVTMEIRKGLEPGDRIILSDMSQWESVDKVRLD
jgi:HlyD family secretion protein